ncbi:MAG: DUF2927 domain-containing protein [Pikeienuella sp.]
MMKAFWGAAVGVALLSACTGGNEYSRYEAIKIREGFLRADVSPEDAPFTNEDLVRNFEAIALNSEFTREGSRLVRAKTPTRLARWEKPVRYRLGGAAVTEADRAAYAGLTRRLSELTGRKIQETGARGDITILILNEAERLEMVRDLRRRRIDDRMRLIVQWASAVDYPCVGQIGFEDANSGEITSALIVVKAELSGMLRQTCIHEELAQTMGLINDDSTVRPSIFNDDQEFALLTEHDEFLLRMLYDPSLSPNMTAEEVRPLLPEIVEKLRPNG